MIYATGLIILGAVALLKGPIGVCDPILAALFTPARPQLGRYEVCTGTGPLVGETEALEAPDAFGTAGSYDRAALARLYGGIRVNVERRVITSGSEVVSITRLSPYPDPSLTRLIQGTMEIRFTLGRPDSSAKPPCTCGSTDSAGNRGGQARGL